MVACRSNAERTKEVPVKQRLADDARAPMEGKKFGRSRPRRRLRPRHRPCTRGGGMMAGWAINVAHAFGFPHRGKNISRRRQDIKRYQYAWTGGGLRRLSARVRRAG